MNVMTPCPEGEEHETRNKEEPSGGTERDVEKDEIGIRKNQLEEKRETERKTRREIWKNRLEGEKETAIRTGVVRDIATFARRRGT